jgi:serine/threonine protein kinase
VEQRFGRYEVRDELGRGGMATVYRAWDPRFHREVAVKVLPRTLAADKAFRSRFEREARAVAGLEHRAIVPVYDFGEEGDDLYLVMRLFPGGNLADRIATKGPFSLEALLPIVGRVAEALDYAHARGVVHRDVKPANVLFDADGEAYLSDFGIARMAEQTASLTGLGVIGSPHYMSPEQARGEASTPASDIYSLGCTVYEALAGRPPFTAENPLAVLMQHLNSEAPALGKIEAEAAVRRAMAKGPGERFATARSFTVALVPPPPAAPAAPPAPVLESTLMASRELPTVVTPRPAPLLETRVAPARSQEAGPGRSVSRPRATTRPSWENAVGVTVGVTVLVLLILIVTGGVFTLLGI